eukprot:gb/GECG01008576.1/.p1 GENE.gb/GECG01008576.1/~~gb/GECG01008576.1/.p1  ORF type:complete len:268 (+),score=31.29 gb/GECG01008576.1/:1-804(+)
MATIKMMALLNRHFIGSVRSLGSSFVGGGSTVSPWKTLTASCLSTEATAAAPGQANNGPVWTTEQIRATSYPPQRQNGPGKKYYNHFKRASRELSEAVKEANERREVMLHEFRPRFPEFKVGDAIELIYAPEIGDKEGTLIRGTVVSKRNKGLDSSFTIINRSGDDAYLATYKYSSPLLRTIRIMRRRHANQGKKATRAKLTWLWDAKESLYKVTKDTKEQWESDLERRIRRELAARGRVASKKNIMEEKDKLLRTGKGILQVDKYQ